MKKVLFIGYGSIALKHIKVLKSLKPEYKIATLRLHNVSKADDLETFFSIDDAKNWKPQIVFVTSPASHHLAHAIIFADLGCHLYIEKPLSHNLDKIEDLSNSISENKLTVIVGYNLRYLDIIQKLKIMLDSNLLGRIFSVRAEVGQWLPDWRPEKDYRNSVSAKNELGGGAILELSHEVDSMRYLIGEINSVCALSDKISDLEIDTEDNVEALLKFKNGTAGSLHLDFLRKGKSRKFTVIGEKGTIQADLIESKIDHFDSTQDRHFSYQVKNSNSYENAQKDFFESIDCRETLIPLEEGVKTLKVCLALKESSENKKFVKVST